MKIGTITFHGAHNYGSVLQAYALQTYIEKLYKENGVPLEYRILNYRTTLQKELYSRPRCINLKNAVKSIMYLPYAKQLKIQEEKFECFIHDRLHLTEEFSRLDELPTMTEKMDLLLSGSDQIWNVRAKDFSFAYLYENCAPKKISYAASLGPLTIDWSQYDTERFINALKKYESISVREYRSRQMLEKLSGVQSEVNVDPTLLLQVDEWRRLQSDYNYQDGKYILFYCLEPRKEHIHLAMLLSQKTGLPVVATRYRNKNDYFNPFIKLYDVGPCDYLSLIDHASIVLTSSFHGTVFSLLYGKKFLVIDGMKDGRIKTLLSMAQAEENQLDLFCKEIDHLPMPIDAESYLFKERERSKKYLIKALGLSENDIR